MAGVPKWLEKRSSHPVLLYELRFALRALQGGIGVSSNHEKIVIGYNPNPSQLVRPLALLSTFHSGYLTPAELPPRPEFIKCSVLC